jgi:hypothetical protein
MATTDNEPTKDLNEETSEELEAGPAPAESPIMEQVLAGLNALREEVSFMREDLALVRSELRDVKNALRSLERRFDVYTQDLMRIRGDVLNHENRLEEIERKTS